jgi:hypothetical protein
MYYRFSVKFITDVEYGKAIVNSISFAFAFTFFFIFAQQMRVVVFLASIFFMLFGNVNSLAGVELNSSNSTPTLQVKKLEAATLNNIGLDKVSGKNSSLPEEYKILICEAVEDEDPNDVSPEKYRSGAAFSSIPFYHSFLNFRHNWAESLSFFWCRSSCRYILHRTLRI